MNSIFYPAGNKQDVKNIETRTVNVNLRKVVGERLNKGKKSAYDDRFAYLELLRVSLGAVAECPGNRAKLFTLGGKGSGREALLRALFNKDVTDDISEVHPIILGKYDAETFQEVKNHNTKRITMEVWNYSWKKAYTYLQDLFMTKCSLYMFVFDMKKILNPDETVVTGEVTYLQSILEIKKLQSPDSSVVLVGTYADDLSAEDIKNCDDIIFQRVLQARNFKVKSKEPGQRIFEVCCDNGRGINKLKERIYTILSQRNFVRDNIPKTVHDAEKMLKETNSPYITYAAARKLFKLIGVNDDDTCEVLLQVLAERGIVVYVHEYEALRRIVVLDPAWLVRACGVAIYFNGRHKVLDHDIDNDQMVADFNTFIYQRVLSKRFLFHVLNRMNYPDEVHEYILNLMKSTCMVADYLLNDIESYLTPTFFDNENVKSDARNRLIRESDYEGPFFFIDFSGRHSNRGFNINGGVWSCFLPFSFFEKLVSLSIQLSASFGQGIQPITRYKKARLSFGAEVDFMLSAVIEENRPLKIKVSTLTGTEQAKVLDLAERIFSMARGIRKDFYPGVLDQSKLVLDLVVPSDDGKPEHFASYAMIQEARSKGIANVIPNYAQPGNVPVNKYDHWLRNGEPLKFGGKVTFIPKAMDGNYALPDGKAQHCFLSYKETSALDIVKKQIDDLRRLGYICWLNKDYQGQLTIDVYKNELKKSMCFVLVLSVDVFESKIIVEELKTAIENDIPIIFLHHPDTNKLGYWSFSQYVNTCPAELRHVFGEVSSIQLQTRFYLQEAVTNQLVRRIQTIMGVGKAKDNV